MKFRFEIETNEDLKQVEKEFEKGITSFSNRYRIETSFEYKTNEDLKRLTVVPFYTFPEMMNENTQAFHKAYLNEFVEDERISLKVLEV